MPYDEWKLAVRAIYGEFKFDDDQILFQMWEEGDTANDAVIWLNLRDARRKADRNV